jgi:hypothetical protein
MGKENRNVSAAEGNEAIFRRYAEEVGNQQNFELVDEIFERHIAHQPDGSTLQRGPQDVKRFQGERISFGNGDYFGKPILGEMRLYSSATRRFSDRVLFTRVRRSRILRTSL